MVNNNGDDGKKYLVTILIYFTLNAPQIISKYFVLMYIAPVHSFIIPRLQESLLYCAGHRRNTIGEKDNARVTAEILSVKTTMVSDLEKLSSS